MNYDKITATPFKVLLHNTITKFQLFISDKIISGIKGYDSSKYFNYCSDSQK